MTKLFKRFLEAGDGRPSSAAGIARRIATLSFNYRRMVDEFGRPLVQDTLDYLADNDEIVCPADFAEVVFKATREPRNASMVYTITDASNAVHWQDRHPRVWRNFDWSDIVENIEGFLYQMHGATELLDTSEVQALLRLAGTRARTYKSGNAYIDYQADGAPFCLRVSITWDDLDD